MAHSRRFSFEAEASAFGATADVEQGRCGFPLLTHLGHWTYPVLLPAATISHSPSHSPLGRGVGSLSPWTRHALGGVKCDDASSSYLLVVRRRRGRYPHVRSNRQ